MSKAEYILSVILIGVMFVAGCAITTKAEVVDNPYQTIPISDEEFEELRWVVALESLSNCIYEQAEEIPIECLYMSWV